MTHSTGFAKIAIETLSAALLLGGCCLSPVTASTTTDSASTTTEAHEVPEPPLSVVTIQWDYVSYTLLVILFLLIVAFVSVLLHHIPKLSEIVPETCILILIGIAVAEFFILAGTNLSNKKFSNQVFMLYMLPPIVLDAAYGLNSRIFAANLGIILVQAVVGTLINFLIIGPALYGLNLSGAVGHLDVNLDLVDCFMFSSFIVAVDPVAVIAIFKDLGVNDMLYFLVFGESLLNDAVTVVIYDMMSNFITQTEIPGTQIAMGVAFFLVSSVGGAAIGLAIGFLTALVTKFTYKLPGAEPIIVLLMAYMSYLLGQLFEWSSIIALTTCGIVQAQFVFPNIAYESELTVKKMAEVLGSTLEASIFLFLGSEIIEASHYWSVGFIGWSILLILVGRAISIFGLTTIANFFRKEKIDLKTQFIMWYGGLRGALAFVLCATLSTNYGPRNLFLTTTIMVIMFTVFVQGMTMRPIVNFCKIPMKDKSERPLLQTIEEMLDDHLLSGIEIIAGNKDRNYIRSQAYRFTNKTRKYFSRFYSTYATKLLEEMELKAFHEVEEIRSEQPFEACICCKSVFGCCGKSSSKSSHSSSSDSFSPHSQRGISNTVHALDDISYVDVVHDHMIMEMSIRSGSSRSSLSINSIIKENGDISNERL